MMVVPCRLCMTFEQDGKALKQQLMQHLMRLPEEQKVEDGLYAERLAHCESCDALHQGVCRHCGCFVLLRAAKKHMGCPRPGGGCW